MADINDLNIVGNTAYVIPNNTNEVVNTGRILIRSVGLNILEKNLYKAGMPAPTVRDTPEISRKSSLNTPIFSNLSVGKITYTLNGQKNTIPAFEIDTVLFTASYQKKVVITEIQGRSEPVIEYISTGHKQITITGIITGKNGVYPQSEMNLLVAACDCPFALPVNSWWLNQFGIYALVFTYIHFQQLPGSQSYQKFEIQAISDANIELKIAQGGAQ